MSSTPITHLILVTLAACGGGTGVAGKPDARVIPDIGDDFDVLTAPYRHTITIDGNDDFTAAEMFPTTSASFTARIAWDDGNLYIGYSGPDIASSTTDAAQKWLFVYLDTVSGGEAQSEMYNTQRATFPAPFAADYYFRYKIDGTLTSLEQNNAGDWETSPHGQAIAQSGDYIELGMPLITLGTGTTVGIVTYMINEKQLAEGTFAGLYADNFADGYATNLTLTRYVEVDFSSPRAPNDPAARKP